MPGISAAQEAVGSVLRLPDKSSFHSESRPESKQNIAADSVTYSAKSARATAGHMSEI